MKRPIFWKIVNEINVLIDHTPKGPGVFDERAYLRARSAIIRKYHYTEKAFQRAARADFEEWRETQ